MLRGKKSRSNKKTPIVAVQSSSGNLPSSPTYTQQSSISHDNFIFTSRRRGFTSELFKLKVSNVPWHINSITVIKSRLRNLNLDPVKVNICRSCWFVTFRNEEARQVELKER